MEYLVKQLREVPLRTVIKLLLCLTLLLLDVLAVTYPPPPKGLAIIFFINVVGIGLLALDSASGKTSQPAEIMAVVGIIGVIAVAVLV